jgi:hypothetical protein
MSDQWYWAKGKQKCGPFTYDQLRQMAAAGAVSPADLLLNEGASQWVPARDVPGMTFPANQVKSTAPTPLEERPARSQERRKASVETVAAPLGKAAPGPPSTVDLVLSVAALLSVPFFCLNEFLGKPFLILAGLIWVVVGVRAVVTGSVPSFTGVPVKRPAYRVAGIFLGLLGVVMMIGGTVNLLFWDRPSGDRAAAPSTPPAATNQNAPPQPKLAPVAVEPERQPRADRRPSIQTLVRLFGKSEQSQEVQALRAEMGNDPKRSDYEDASYLIWYERGVEILFDKKQPIPAVKTIFLHAKSRDEHKGAFLNPPYQEYCGELPCGLSFKDSRDDVERRLGKPDEVGGGGPQRLWVNYKRLGISLNYAAKEVGERMDQIDFLYISEDFARNEQAMPRDDVK